ncbi:hypothetical protein [Methanothrix sp.]|uniref:hypothetical protein n=1 Tax=Methanothrix sp. TaxID=90426 RepID=UPI001BD3F1FE
MSQFFNILLRAGLIAMSGWIIPMAFKQLTPHIIQIHSSELCCHQEDAHRGRDD